MIEKDRHTIRLYYGLIGMVLSSIVMGCELDHEKLASSAHDRLDEDTHSERMTILDRPPVIAATSSADVQLAEAKVDRLDLARISRRPDARSSATDALPYLSGTTTGRAFLRGPLPRALARGNPPEMCPAEFSVTGAKSRSAAVRAAFDGCLAALRSRPGCGCRLFAIDHVLTVPRNEAAYATGVTARLSVPGLGIDGLAVAEEDIEDGLILRDLEGVFAHVRRNGEHVTVRFEKLGRTFEGRSIRVGFRRGRIAERIYATDADGNRLSLLVGFEPSELAAGAARWLAWPQG